MGLKTISINAFDPKSFEKAIAEVANVEQRLQDGLNELCRTLLDEGVEIAKAEIMDLNAVDTGALMASIDHGGFDPATKTGYIYAGAYYAFFVEYGTGMRGGGSPHPNASVSNFAVLGGNGRKTYEGYSSKPGWYYYANGRWHYTEGMAARPFMYNTMMTLADKAASLGGEIIGTFIAGGG